jgi:hypothetical protein
MTKLQKKRVSVLVEAYFDLSAIEKQAVFTKLKQFDSAIRHVSPTSVSPDFIVRQELGSKKAN